MPLYAFVCVPSKQMSQSMAPQIGPSDHLFFAVPWVAKKVSSSPFMVILADSPIDLPAKKSSKLARSWLQGRRHDDDAFSHDGLKCSRSFPSGNGRRR